MKAKRKEIILEGEPHVIVEGRISCVGHLCGYHDYRPQDLPARATLPPRATPENHFNHLICCKCYCPQGHFEPKFFRVKPLPVFDGTLEPYLVPIANVGGEPPDLPAVPPAGEGSEIEKAAGRGD